MSAPSQLSNDSPNVAMAGPPPTPLGQAPGKLAQCEKCLTPLPSGRTMICPRCGWYAIAGTYLDIDRSMEDDDVPAAAADDAKIPRWAWLAIASVVIVIIESAVARIVTSDGSSARTTWSGAQFVLGILGFLLCQVVGFIVLMRQDSSIAILDVLLKPFKISGALFRELPRRFWVVNAGISGLAAVFAAVVIIGSVPYHVLWTWSIDYRSTQTLEDALAQQMAPKGKIEPKLPPGHKIVDCVIIGYELTEAGNIRVVLLARERYGRLEYVGGISPSGDPAQLFELREHLLSNPAVRPAIPMTFNSNWVMPKFTCQISCGSEQDNGKLTDIRWEGDVRQMRPR